MLQRKILRNCINSSMPQKGTILINDFMKQGKIISFTSCSFSRKTRVQSKKPDKDEAFTPPEGTTDDAST